MKKIDQNRQITPTVTAGDAIAVIGVGAVMPDAPDATAFWDNVMNGRDCITDVPSDRWDAGAYWSPDPKEPDKTYCKIGAFVRDFTFDFKRFRIPPRTVQAMDPVQLWAMSAAGEALENAGYLDRDFDRERTAVVIGNSMAGELHYSTSVRVMLPEVIKALEEEPSYQNLPGDVQSAMLEGLRARIDGRLPPVTEDSMPGELANVISGRVANTFNLGGASYTVDAACASSLAALDTAVNGLRRGEYDMVVAGGVDRSMSPPTFVKFCKIGALSAEGSFPFDARAGGFVMGEGCAMFILKRWSDAVRDGDRVLSVILGIGSSSDGRGKGIAAPNKDGQLRALRRAYEITGLAPRDIDLIEAHGTSTKVGDPVEVDALSDLYRADELGTGRVALGSVKSQIGHLKSAAGAASLLKTTLALHHRVIPPSIHFETPNPRITFERTPFHVPLEPREWANGRPRRAAISAFGFGGTNFHVLLQEASEAPTSRTATPGFDAHHPTESSMSTHSRTITTASVTEDLLGRVAFISASSQEALMEALESGERPRHLSSLDEVARFAQEPVRLAVAGEKPEVIEKKVEKLLAAMKGGYNERKMRVLQRQGVHLGTGGARKVAYLFPGQGSQSVGMLADLYDRYEEFRSVFEEADAVLEPILGHGLTEIVYPQDTSEEEAQRLEERLKQTEVTQPAMLAADIAMARVLENAGLTPEMMVGHSLGEYAALLAAGTLSLRSAMEIVAARGREMTSVSLDDPGRMLAVMADAETVQELICRVDGYLVPANKNSSTQTVVAGESGAVEKLMGVFEEEGVRAVPLRVSHAFHSRIVAPASEPLRRVLARHEFAPPRVPVFTNVTGEAYPQDAEADMFVDVLARQIASPVEFVSCIRSMYEHGARLFVEVGPRRVLASFAEDVLKDAGDVTVTCANNHRIPDLDGLANMWAAAAVAGAIRGQTNGGGRARAGGGDGAGVSSSRTGGVMSSRGDSGTDGDSASDGTEVVISGSALGLPGRDRDLFTDDAIDRILEGTSFLEQVPEEIRQVFPTLNLTRIDKGTGEDLVERPVDDASGAIKLAGQVGRCDLHGDYGIEKDLATTLDSTARMALAAGLEALRAAGIPLTQRTHRTRTGAVLPTGWVLPEVLRDETGVIFASAFPGMDRLAGELEAYYHHRLAGRPYTFDRKVLFGILSMGHTQFAQAIHARGPNTQVNSACASTSVAVSTATDWIRTGRCRRVIVISADNASGANLLPWVGGGFLANGAAATDERAEDAALPFDERRHGLLVGAGACALVVENGDEVAARGSVPMARIVHTQLGNSAFHGSRLDAEHVAREMDRFVSRVETITRRSRSSLAEEMVFFSHETYTPARGGSADTEVESLRRAFGNRDLAKILVVNTKGFTGHPMGVGFEDALAPWILHTGKVPPIANLSRTDPLFADLNLSKGGRHDVRWVLRFSAGFGSQVALILLEKTSQGQRLVVDENLHRSWLQGLLGGREGRLEVSGRVLHLVAAQEASAGSAGPEKTSEKEPARDLRAEILAMVAEKTGYPEDMLDPEMDMEADLGIDTVKQAELFAEVRKRYEIPRQENLKLTDYPTINHVVGFVSGFVGDVPARKAAPAPEPAPPAETTAPEDATSHDLRSEILAMVAEKTGYPEDMLDPEMDMEADLGIDTVKQAELFAEVRKRYEIPRQENLKLTDYPTINHVVGFVGGFVGDVPAPEPAPPAETTAPEDATSHDLLSEILAMVAEKTGYPEDMLDPEMDMEADLGIDTVKQAELFAEVRKRYEIPRQENLKLTDYPTINHVVGFVGGFVGDVPVTRDVKETQHPLEDATQPAAQARPSVPPAAVEARNGSWDQEAGEDRFQARMLAPRPLWLPPAAVFPATGRPVSGPQRPVVLVGTGDVADALRASLESRSVSVMDGHASRSRDESVGGVILLDDVHQWTGLEELGAYCAEVVDRTVDRFEVVRDLLASKRMDPDEAFVVGVTFMGGTLGYGSVPSTAPSGGALSGFVKSMAMEFPTLVAKVVDLDPVDDPTLCASRVMEEIGADALTTEVGYRRDQRWGVTLDEIPVPGDSLSDALGRRPVILLTGGAGGIMGDIAERLASRLAARIVLTDIIVPEAGEETESTSRIIDAIERVERAGGTGLYVQADVMDPGSVERAVRAAVARFGRIDAVLHGAGMEQSRGLAKKDTETFRRIVAIKVAGAGNLAGSVMTHCSPRCFLFFSSVAGRFGNAGQADYSAGNDFMTRLASYLSGRHPEVRFTAVDWTAWDGPGMAGNSAIRAVLEDAGIDVLDRAEGAEIATRIIAGDQGVPEEVVVGQSLGILEERMVRAEGRRVAVRLKGQPRADETAEWTCGRLERSFTVDPAEDSWLWDHAVEGTPVLPAVMGLHAFVQTGRGLMGGLSPTRFESSVFRRAVKFFDGKSRSLRVLFTPTDVMDGAIVATCSLDTASRNRMQGGRVEHFSARIRFAPAPDPDDGAGPAVLLGRGEGLTLVSPGFASMSTDEAQDVYRYLFHGPGYQVLRSFRHGGRRPEMGVGDLDPGDRIAPGDLYMLTELGMQTAGMWLLRSNGVAALPAAIDSIHVLAPIRSGRPYRAVSVYRGDVQMGAEGNHHVFDVTLMDDKGRTVLWLESVSLVETGARPEARHGLPSPDPVGDTARVPRRG